MKTVLVGSTGFVGRNLARSREFDGAFHRTDVADAYGMKPDLLVYAGVPSEMFLANSAPERDRQTVENAMENIRRISPKRAVLISTVAVYPKPAGVDEESEIKTDGLPAYGIHRLALEQFVEDSFSEYLIVRLPALFGDGLKKNFLYDFIHRIPALLTEEKWRELSDKDEELGSHYRDRGDGFFACRSLDAEEETDLRRRFGRIGFSSLSFTDSRSVYQFYGLGHLWEHIEKALSLGIRKLNLATEPIAVSELYCELTGEEFVNELEKEPFYYDVRSRYAEEFGGRGGYIFSKEQVVREIREFVRESGAGVV